VHCKTEWIEGKEQYNCSVYVYRISLLFGWKRQENVEHPEFSGLLILFLFSEMAVYKRTPSSTLSARSLFTLKNHLDTESQVFFIFGSLWWFRAHGFYFPFHYLLVGGLTGAWLVTSLSLLSTICSVWYVWYCTLHTWPPILSIEWLSYIIISGRQLAHL